MMISWGIDFIYDICHIIWGEFMIKENLSKEHMTALAKFGLGGLGCEEMAALYFKKDEYIQRQGYECPYVMLVFEGKLKIYITAPDGKTLLYCYCEAGGIVGEVEFATQSDTAASTIQTITDVCCIGIPRSRYQNELKQNIHFMNAVCTTLGEKLFYTNEHNTVTILNKLETRLCAYIAMTHVGGCFNEKLTEISEVLSTSYRHLLRTFDKLCREGILEKTGRGYLIKDEARLRLKGDQYHKG